MPRFTVRVFGRPSVAYDDRPLDLSPGANLLCAYLALAPPEGRPRDVAARHLFGEDGSEPARRRLNTAIWRLRRSVRSHTGFDLVRASDQRAAVSLDPAVAVTTDATQFADLVLPVLRVPPTAVEAAGAKQLEAAVALHRGRLVESCDDEWVLADRYRIEQLYVNALDYLLQYHGNRRDLGSVSRYGDLALELEPLREDVHRHLMTAYASVGRIDLVERQFERCRRVLIEELGTDPLPETVVLYSRLMREMAAPPKPSRLRAARGSGGLEAMIRDLEDVDRTLAEASGVVARALHRLRGAG